MGREGESQQGEARKAGGPEPQTPQPAGCLCLDFPICTMDHYSFIYSFVHSFNKYLCVRPCLNALSRRNQEKPLL